MAGVYRPLDRFGLFPRPREYTWENIVIWDVPRVLDAVYVLPNTRPTLAGKIKK